MKPNTVANYTETGKFWVNVIRWVMMNAGHLILIDLFNLFFINLNIRCAILLDVHHLFLVKRSKLSRSLKCDDNAITG